MAQSLLATIVFGFLVLLSSVMSEDHCLQTVVGGGCPNTNQCRETCRPCYTGIGEVHYYCRAADGLELYDTCVCEMVKGAPCQVRGCPKPWGPPVVAANITET
ncbi:hypothetical protein P8452_23448 [Trifolium repens]|nr:hypothetical protein P8452_23448 [Trifolium repens]